MITGAGSGIGRASALLFAHEGAKVRPVQLVIVALVFVVLFILAIRTLVHFVTS